MQYPDNGGRALDIPKLESLESASISEKKLVLGFRTQYMDERLMIFTASVARKLIARKSALLSVALLRILNDAHSLYLSSANPSFLEGSAAVETDCLPRAKLLCRSLACEEDLQLKHQSTPIIIMMSKAMCKLTFGNMRSHEYLPSAFSCVKCFPDGMGYWQCNFRDTARASGKSHSAP